LLQLTRLSLRGNAHDRNGDDRTREEGTDHQQRHAQGSHEAEV
jgi:hypothetical protein